METESKNKFIKIDEEGYFHFDGMRVTDPDIGSSLFSHLEKDGWRYKTTLAGTPAIVEAFDEILVALQIERPEAGPWEIQVPYDVKFSFDPRKVTLDEWDRFHGYTDSGLPFVFSRTAQNEFFDLLDAFDDESITIGGERFVVGPWLKARPEIREEKFWTGKWQEPQKPNWDLGQVSPALEKFFPKLKLNKSRILVIGAGAGHDAAWFAERGHIVTAVDFSPEAKAKFESTYPGLRNIRFQLADAFSLPTEWNKCFDVVFEHTCYCAIDPERRNDLVKTWQRVLVDNGNLLGVFFAMDKPEGPPFGGSEWEIRERLKKGFDFLHWERSHHSAPDRLGTELCVFAQKK